MRILHACHHNHLFSFSILSSLLPPPPWQPRVRWHTRSSFCLFACHTYCTSCTDLSTYFWLPTAYAVADARRHLPYILLLQHTSRETTRRRRVTGVNAHNGMGAWITHRWPALRPATRVAMRRIARRATA